VECLFVAFALNAYVHSKPTRSGSRSCPAAWLSVLSLLVMGLPSCVIMVNHARTITAHRKQCPAFLTGNSRPGVALWRRMEARSFTALTTNHPAWHVTQPCFNAWKGGRR
jgi:hypothetical protein